MQTLIGKKIGMTRVYDDAGVQVPVTVVQVGPCVVVQRKSAKPDGYEAVQLGFQEQKESRLTKAEQGHFKKAGTKAQKVVRNGKITTVNKRVSGTVVLTAAQKARMRKLGMKAHTASAISRRHRSLTKGINAGIYYSKRDKGKRAKAAAAALKAAETAMSKKPVGFYDL